MEKSLKSAKWLKKPISTCWRTGCWSTGFSRELVTNEERRSLRTRRMDAALLLSSGCSVYYCLHRIPI